MAKTIKELADEIGVTKQAINKLLTKEVRQQHVTIISTNGGRALQIDKYAEALIKKHFNGGNEVEKGSNESQQIIVATLKEQVQMQKKELVVKNDQLIESNKRLRDMQKLLDQSQQLQLMAEKKIAALEVPKQAEDAVDQNKESPVSSVPKGQKKDPSGNQKRGLWHNLFK